MSCEVGLMRWVEHLFATLGVIGCGGCVWVWRLQRRMADVLRKEDGPWRR